MDVALIFEFYLALFVASFNSFIYLFLYSWRTDRTHCPEISRACQARIRVREDLDVRVGAFPATPLLSDLYRWSDERRALPFSVSFITL